MKNIIFDLGSVLIKDHSYSVLDKMSLNKKEYDELLRFFKDFDKLDLGLETLEEKFEKCSFDKSLYKYKNSIIKYYESRDINEDLINIIKQLKDNYKIYILSDNNKEAIDYYKNKLNFIDGMVVSCDYQTLKKDGKLFEILLDKYNLNPSECYFIDDRLDNIEAGKKLGIKGFLFDENKNINLLYEDMIKNGIHVINENEKVVIFDWGGVILKEYPNHYCDRDAITDTIKKFNNNLNYEDAYQLYLNTLYDENGKIISILDDYTDKYKWYERINKEGNLNTAYEEFTSEFINNYKKIDKYEDVVNYIYSLKDKIKIYLFSDLIFTCYESLKKHIDLNIFDDIFLSYKEGYTKSDIKAFINVNNKLNNKNILFIDNNTNNIENAKKIGWNTLCCTGEDMNKIKNEVEKFMDEKVDYFKNDEYWIEHINKPLEDDIWIDEYSEYISNSGLCLDLGCGIGQYTKWFMDKGYDVISADISNIALEKVKQFNKNIINLDMRDKLPFEDNKFDIIFANLSIHYFNDKDTKFLLNEIRRILKDNGLFIGSVNGIEGLDKIKETANELEHHFYFNKRKYIRLFDIKDLEEYLSIFNILKIEEKQTIRFGNNKNYKIFIVKK